MSASLFLHRSSNSSMSMRRKVEHVRRTAFLHKTKKFKHVIADAYMTFQGTRETKHGAQPWQSIISLPKSSWGRSTNKEFLRRFLTAPRMMKCFHASQLQHNWTEEWCEHLDYIGTIDTTHNASPDRYAALYHFRYLPKSLEKGLVKSCPDYQKNTRAIVSMNKEAGQNPQIISRRIRYRDDLDPEKLEWLIWLSHNWKWHFAVNRHSDLNSTQRHHRESEKRASLGKPRRIDSYI